MDWRFTRRGGPERLDVETLLAKARAASSAVPVPGRSIGGAGFRMMVDHVYFISGRGVFVTGLVSDGVVHVKDAIAILHKGRRRCTTVVEAIEKASESLELASVGESAGLLLADINRREICSGDILTASN
ncbi:MAG TPA: hypothetical protein VKB55_00865 [Nocardioidaceae bacterium]|jgi:translation elongation factor EF-Tu-like GTPase|nr:hypothetical protein [Nocardioidaceae bacterium]